MGIEIGAFRPVDQKWYARQPSNFVNVWIWCSATFLYFPYIRKGNVRRKTAGKVRGIPPCNCTVEVCKLHPLVVPLLGVRATHNTETTFSTFSRDLSRCFNLYHYCA